MSLYHVTLKKIESNHNNLRTNEITGVCHKLPEVGGNFILLSTEVLTPGTNMRRVTTSEITEVRFVENDIVFKTQNSLYSLTIIEGIDDTKYH
jgi:hypothetical protein